jgi:hypothetical protein
MLLHPLPMTTSISPSNLAIFAHNILQASSSSSAAFYDATAFAALPITRNLFVQIVEQIAGMYALSEYEIGTINNNINNIDHNLLRPILNKLAYDTFLQPNDPIGQLFQSSARTRMFISSGVIGPPESEPYPHLNKIIRIHIEQELIWLEQTIRHITHNQLGNIAAEFLNPDTFRLKRGEAPLFVI